MGDEVLDRHLLLLANGFLLNFALVASIGAQNVLIIRQGLLRNHLLLVVVTCFVVDTTIITLGSLGFGAVLGAEERLASVAAWAGVLFLLVYAIRRLRSALEPHGVGHDQRHRARGRYAVIASALAVSLLNPQLYLDSFVVIGGLTAPLPLAQRAAFASGALLASLAWFAGLGLAVKRFSNRFLTDGFWRTVDVAACCSMLVLAAAMAWHHDLVPATRAIIGAIG